MLGAEGNEIVQRLRQITVQHHRNFDGFQYLVVMSQMGFLAHDCPPCTGQVRLMPPGGQVQTASCDKSAGIVRLVIVFAPRISHCQRRPVEAMAFRYSAGIDLSVLMSSMMAW